MGNFAENLNLGKRVLPPWKVLKRQNSAPNDVYDDVVLWIVI